MATISLQKTQIDRKGGVVVLTLAEYERLRERAVPTYYLRGKTADTHDRVVSRAVREYQVGKSRRIRSLAELS